LWADCRKASAPAGVGASLDFLAGLSGGSVKDAGGGLRGAEVSGTGEGVLERGGEDDVDWDVDWDVDGATGADCLG